MISIKLDFNDDTFNKIQAQIKQFEGGNAKYVFPEAKAAFDSAVRSIQKAWQNWAMGGSIEGAQDIKKPNPLLAQSIRVEYVNDFDAKIGTDSPEMQRIINGKPDIYMKEPSSPWLKSHKTRVNKKGEPYLIIPFQWGTPNSKGGNRAHFSAVNTIPKAVYDAYAKKMSKSAKTGETYFTENIYGEMVERQKYAWGDRLKADRNINGLVRMKANPKSTYFTFRVLSARSKADWHIKAVPANPVVQSLENAMKPIVGSTIAEGFKGDLQ